MAATASPTAPVPVKGGVAPLRAGQGSSFWLRRLHSLSGIVPIGAFLIEHFPQQPRVARVVFDQEKPLGCLPTHRCSAFDGSLTFVNQKSLMLLTRFSNSSSCTGLER